MLRVSLCLFVAIGFVQITFVFSQSVNNSTNQSVLWENVSEENLANRGQRHLRPEKYLVYRLGQTELTKILDSAPHESGEEMRNEQVVLTVPKPDGKFVRFRLEESPILSPEIAAQNPIWKTYQGYGIDEPNTSARFDWTDTGFHGYVLATEGTYSIDPYQTNDRENYQVFYKNEFGNPTRDFHCKLDEVLSDDKGLVESFTRTTDFFTAFTHGTQIRNYRLAIATTFEYTSFFRQTGDTDSQAQTRALNAVVTSINRIDAVYRKELAISFTLVSGTNLTFIVNPETPANYANTGSSADLNINQTNVDSIIGNANYDISHLFETTDGGIAGLGVVCATGGKARGLSGQPNPVGDPFDVDYVAHEMGHQFGANHTFNSTSNCNSAPAAARREPGSAVTIMGYAGICSSNSNVQRNSIDTFHVYNLGESITFVTSGGGSTCGTTSGANAVPVIAALPNYTIPFNTPFALTASATDADNDPINYNWEQSDPSASPSSYPGTVDDDDTSLVFRPGFRSYLPTVSATRSFPSLPYILNNSNEAPVTFTGTSTTGSICAGTCISGEDLPSAARTMNFRVSVRDGRGGISDAGTVITVVNSTTPFKVTTQNSAPTTWTANSPQTITWNVSGTNAAPVSATNVRISLSTDGGQTFPIILRGATANDGSETINAPIILTTSARIKIEAVGNIFFDINDINFTISNQPTFVSYKPFDFDGDGKADISVYRSGNWYLLRSQQGFAAVNFGLANDKTVAADYDGDGKADVAIFRNGTWVVQNSSNNAVVITNWGQAGDIPMVGDYDGDAKADFTVFRNGVWYILQSSNGGFVFQSFGLSTDKPVVGNFDNDNKQDLAVFRNGIWYIQGSQAGFFAISFGQTGDIAVPADYDNDGKTDVAVYRGGTWFISGSTAGFSAVSFGVSTDTPTPADFDGDGKADVAVFRSSNGTWFLQQSTSGFSAVTFGQNGDRPIPAQ